MEFVETLRDHAHALVRQGRAAEADAVIERALELYTSVGARIRAAELEDLRELRSRRRRRPAEPGDLSRGSDLRDGFDGAASAPVVRR